MYYTITIEVKNDKDETTHILKGFDLSDHVLNMLDVDIKQYLTDLESED